MVRHDGPAEVRLYRGEAAGCTFLVFLYRDTQSRHNRTVEHIEARTSDGRLEGPAVHACLAALVAPAAPS